MSKIKRASYSIEEEYKDLFKAIAAKTRRSMTEELRLMIDARAVTVGLEPIQYVDPKLSTSHREVAR